MKINQFSYYDSNQKWQFENINFSDFNLLVGVSGVGKSKILNAIINLQKIAEGNSLNGVKWDLKFILDGSNYRWQGEFENSREIDILLLGKSSFRIISEHLYKEDVLIIERNKYEIRFNGNVIPKLSPFQSVVSILYTEDSIKPFYTGLNQVLQHEPQKDFLIVKDHYNEIANKIRKSLHKENPGKLTEQEFEIMFPIFYAFDIAYKIVFVYENNPRIFCKIKDAFISIFDQVEDVQIEEVHDNTINEVLQGGSSHFSNLTPQTFILIIKEKGVDEWIKQNEISSGMLKTFMLISELYLSAEGTVILIDEFENSLGINCIDIISDLILENRNLQFIITSHHPYIINNIGMEHWKIITRKGGVVTARDAKDLNLGKSRHQAFMQLMNLEEYKEGITA